MIHFFFFGHRKSVLKEWTLIDNNIKLKLNTTNNITLNLNQVKI